MSGLSKLGTFQRRKISLCSSEFKVCINNYMKLRDVITQLCHIWSYGCRIIFHRKQLLWCPCPCPFSINVCQKDFDISADRLNPSFSVPVQGTARAQWIAPPKWWQRACWTWHKTYTGTMESDWREVPKTIISGGQIRFNIKAAL